MPQSLRSTINQPTFTKGIIKLALRSPEGSRRVWCVVEGADDIAIYERMFNVDAVKVIPYNTGTHFYFFKKRLIPSLQCHLNRRSIEHHHFDVTGVVM